MARTAEKDRAMSRRRTPISRRRPSSLPRLELLEPRTLLTFGSISINAPVTSIKTTAVPTVQAIYNIAAVPSGYNAYATVIETVSPSTATLPTMKYGSTTISSGSSVLAGSTASPAVISLLGPTATPNNVDETVTLTLSNPGGCGGTWGLSQSSASITFHFPSATQQTAFCDSKKAGLATTASPGSGISNPSAMSGAGVAYGSGGVSVRSPSYLTSDGFSSIPLGLDLGWTNEAGYGTTVPGTNGLGSVFGLGMLNADMPMLEQGPSGGLIATADAGNALFFSYNGSTYAPELYSQDTLVASGNNFLLTRTDGTVLDYYGFGSSIPAAQQGQLDYYKDPTGNLTQTNYATSNGASYQTGQLMSLTRQSGSISESYVFNYIAPGSYNAGLVSSVALTRTPYEQATYTVQQVAFTYYQGTYTGGDTYGNLGNLKTEQLKDASGNVIGTTYFRYYTPLDLTNSSGQTVGYVGGLQYQLDPQSFSRLAATLSGGTTPGTVAESQLAPYADQYYQYDSLERVSETVVQGAGCSCSGSSGEGTYTYGYTTNPTPPSASNYNGWLTETTETLPDGNQNLIYSNTVGEVMVSAFHDISDDSDSALNGLLWVADNRYDSSGRVILEAQPSAVTITSASTLAAAASSYADIVGYNGSNAYVYLSSNSGLIDLTVYGSTTTATTTAAGNVAGYLEFDEIEQGYAGTAIVQDGTTYISHSNLAGAAVYPVASTTVYRNTNGTGGETTAYSYTWYTYADQIQSMTETDPVITTAENGPNSADVTTTYYDPMGMPTWTKDADGFIDYTQYDPGTEAVVETIVDVNTNLVNDFATAPTTSSLPSGWTTPTGGGLNLVTTYQVDGQGRTTKMVSPAGNITYAVYDDPDHEVRVYAGWNPLTGLPTGPTQVTRIDYTDNYTETFTMTATPTVVGAAGRYIPTGAEAISGLVTLDRQLNDTTGREVEDDSYFAVSGLTYATTARLGTLGMNYYATDYGYDEMGRQSRVVDAVGTITDTLFDALGRVYKTQVGTDDTYQPGPTGPSNMVTVTTDQYDGNGVGDSNLTQETTSPDSVADDNRTTLMAYDWRDRLVATKSGDQLSLGAEDSVTYRPITFDVLDNLGEVTATYEYDGDGLSLSLFNPNTFNPTTQETVLLRAYSTTAYDEQGQSYQENTFEVNQSSGAISTSALTTNIYYDHRGDVIATYAPGGLVTKDQYDGAGRLVSDASTDGLAGTSWSAAGSLTGDDVLTQTLTTYDLDGNPTRTTTAERDHDSTDTGALITSSPAATPAAPGTVQIVDDSSPSGFLSVGGFQTYSGGNLGTEQSVNNAPSASATWSFNVTPGTYTIAATWLAYSGNTTGATYTISIGSSQTMATVNQQNSPSGFSDQGSLWQELGGGSFTVTGTLLQVSLQGVSGAFAVADAIRIQQVVLPQIIDDSSATGYSTTSSGGAFSSFSGGFVGTLQGVNNGAGSTASWTFTVAPGTYSVAATWTTYSGDTTSAPYVITSGSTTLGTYYVNQVNAPVGFSDQGGTWQQLGGVFTVTGTTLTVTLDGVSGNWVSADAIRIEPVSASESEPTQVLPTSPTQIIDDSGSTGYSSTGLSNFSGGYDGTHQGVNNSPSALATWTFTVTPGIYSVAATWTLYSGCVPSIGYNVYNGTSGGTLLGTYTVDQQNGPSGFIDQGGTWQELGGTFTITGTTLTVTLPGASGGWISADAIRIQRVDARVSSTTAYYDAADRPVASVNLGTNGGVPYVPPVLAPPDSNTVLVSTAQYNSAGWDYLDTDPRGIVTQTTYDALGRPTKVISDYTNGVVTTSSNQTTTTTYDGIDDVIMVTAVEPSGTPNEMTTYTYGVSTSGSNPSDINDNDLLASVTQPTVSGIATETTSYTYDAAGDVLTMTYPNGVVHTYAYDVLDRQVADAVTTLPSGVDSTVQLLTTAYDSLGNPYLRTSYSGPTTGSTIVNQVEDLYNGLDQLIGEYQSVSGAVNTSTTPEVQYTYTEMLGGVNNSRPTSIVYPNGVTLDFFYTTPLNDSISRIGSIYDLTDGTFPDEYVYLGLDTIVTEDRIQPQVDLSYIKLPGQSNVISDGGDQYTGLDRFGRVIDQNWINGSTGASVTRYQYGYDRDSEVLYRNDLVDSALSELYHANSATSGDNNTAYDGLGRLTSFSRGTLSASGNNGSGALDTVASSSSSQSWSLDALGNWVSTTTTTAGSPSTMNQTFNAQNESSSETYNLNGNTLSTTNGDTYTYDAWNRLMSVKSSSGTLLASYSYDASGDRITETYYSGGTGTTTNLYYSGGQVIEERTGGTSSSNVTYQYVYGISGNLIFRDQYSGGSVVTADRLYALTDANGDVTALVNTSGSVVERYDYSPYGVVTVLNASGTPVSGNTSAYNWIYLFQGGRLDMVSGFYEFGARDYNPANGTWMERDPIGLSGGTADLYQFTGSDPVNETDPTGLDWRDTLSSGLQVLGGTLEVGAGVAIGAAAGWTGIGLIPATLLAAHGADNIGTGLGGLTSGQASRTLTAKGVTSITGSQLAGDVVDAAIPLVAGIPTGPVAPARALVPVLANGTATVARSAPAIAPAAAAGLGSSMMMAESSVVRKPNCAPESEVGGSAPNGVRGSVEAIDVPAAQKLRPANPVNGEMKLYHGGTQNNVNNIRTNGIKPVGLDDGIFNATTDPAVAVRYANHPEWGNVPRAVAVIRIPEEIFQDLFRRGLIVQHEFLGPGNFKIKPEGQAVINQLLGH
jgi:RHS repeat-associated protein